MTVTYNAEVASIHIFGVFWKLLFRWKGSIYKLVLPDLGLYVVLYFSLNLSYKFFMSDYQRLLFEEVAKYCSTMSDSIPMSFVLGFYVTIVVQRWWDQYMCIPWPDALAIYVSSTIQGSDERGRMVRRTIMRYVNLSLVYTMSQICSRVKRRFPTLEHLVEAGILMETEKQIFEAMNKKTPHLKYWMPLAWAGSIVVKARKEGRIRDDFAVKTLIDSINAFRLGLGSVLNYDWVSIPLVYTQTVSLAVYTFFLAEMMGRQFLQTDSSVDLLVPVFSFLSFFFYMGWLRVAETLINPFGDDDDDFEVNWLIDRNIQVSYIIVDEMHEEHPELVRDQYWEEVIPGELPYTAETEQYRRNPPEGSATIIEAKRTHPNIPRYHPSEIIHHPEQHIRRGATSTSPEMEAATYISSVKKTMKTAFSSINGISPGMQSKPSVQFTPSKSETTTFYPSLRNTAPAKSGIFRKISNRIGNQGVSILTPTLSERTLAGDQTPSISDDFIIDGEPGKDLPQPSIVNGQEFVQNIANNVSETTNSGLIEYSEPQMFHSASVNSWASIKSRNNKDGYIKHINGNGKEFPGLIPGEYSFMTSLTKRDQKTKPSVDQQSIVPPKSVNNDKVTVLQSPTDLSSSLSNNLNIESSSSWNRTSEKSGVLRQLITMAGAVLDVYSKPVSSGMFTKTEEESEEPKATVPDFSQNASQIQLSKQRSSTVSQSSRPETSHSSQDTLIYPNASQNSTGTLADNTVRSLLSHSSQQIMHYPAVELNGMKQTSTAQTFHPTPFLPQGTVVSTIDPVQLHRKETISLVSIDSNEDRQQLQGTKASTNDMTSADGLLLSPQTAGTSQLAWQAYYGDQALLDIDSNTMNQQLLQTHDMEHLERNAVNGGNVSMNSSDSLAPFNRPISSSSAPQSVLSTTSSQREISLIEPTNTSQHNAHSSTVHSTRSQNETNPILDENESESHLHRTRSFDYNKPYF